MAQIIRFHQQDFFPRNKEDLNRFLSAYGLEVVKFKYSSFGGCYFVEVKGDLEEDGILYKIETSTKDFDWDAF